MIKFPETGRTITIDLNWIKENSGLSKTDTPGVSRISNTMSIQGYEPDQALLDKFSESLTGKRKNG